MATDPTQVDDTSPEVIDLGDINEPSILQENSKSIGNEDLPDPDQVKNFEAIDDVVVSEDDEGVVTQRKRKTKKETTPSISPNRNRFTDVPKKNPVVTSFIRDRKTFVPSWTLAAESVFSDSHPFKNKKRNRSHEESKTQVKEHVSSRSSSESRCSSPKNKKRNSFNKADFNANTTLPAQEEVTSEHRKVKRQRPRRKDSRSNSLKNNSKSAEVKNQPNQDVSTTALVAKQLELKETKSDSPKSGEDSKHSSRKKRMSLSGSRQRQGGLINGERLLYLKNRVDTAIREHKVYSMTGHYSSVRRALKQRGWVEKIDSDFKGRRKTYRIEESDEMTLQSSGKAENNEKDLNDLQACHAEAEIINRMLRNIPEDLCWLSKPYPYCWKDMNKCDMINRLPKAYFSNKVGLCNSLANMQWYYEEGVCSTQYPRTYNMSMRDDYDLFKDDFRLTSCVGALKWLTTNYKQGGETSVRSPEGRVDVNIIEFALRRCAEYVKFREHEDIDILEMPPTWEHQWDHFLTQYYKLVHEGNLLREAKDDPPAMVIVSNAQTMINLMRPYWPQMDIEGYNNFWIVKPGGRCCGNGILIRSNLEQILAIVNPTITRETRYVVQKYIEKPLLIYNTKFDIRQWFLVTNVYPLTIWMYKESYLRFCSTTFNLKSTHEAIHLCNNAVQRRYKNGKRDRNLPDENMWDCYTFQTHLKAIGYPTVWDDVIYPGMKESFVGALLASQDSMERRRNCFELYGADFMVSEQLTDGPWLIEINSNPAMDSSTSVTARMCPQVLEDTIKVVIDRKNDKNASTGAFEMVFKQNCPPIPPYLGMTLSIRGKKLHRTPPESRKFRRSFHHHQFDVSSDSSDDENIVQRRCSTDFMQPIKTLRDEIRRLGVNRSKEELLSVREEMLSDSAANDSDTSHGSNSDRKMALEGKEIELKRKKSRKRRHRIAKKNESKYKYRLESGKHDSGSRKDDDTSSKKRLPDKPTDWVRRNIESVRGYNISRVFDKSTVLDDDETTKHLGKSQENLQVYKDYILSGQCFEDYKTTTNNKNSHEVLETLFREEMTKIIHASEATEFSDPLCVRSYRSNNGSEVINKRDDFDRGSQIGDKSIVKPIQGPVIITGLWEPNKETVDNMKENDADMNAFKRSVTNTLGVDNVEQANSEGPSRATSYSSINMVSENYSTSNGDVTECESEKSTSRSMDPTDPTTDFDTKFEKELMSLEGKDEKIRTRNVDKDFTQALSIIAPDIGVKERVKSHKWQNNTKTSMEYFREWKYKINETRRNCEDMLAKLRHFKENNSKIQFQSVLQRRIEEETRLIRKMKHFKMAKPWGSSGALGNFEEVDLVEQELPKKPKSMPKKDPTVRIYTPVMQYKENRCSNYFFPAEETPLAISSQSGAVRNVSDILPKIKLRNRPLLPNAGSGHCRNVNLTKINDKNLKAKRL